MAKKGEARVTFVAETKEFTQGIAQINKSLANLRSDLKLCNTELKANGDSFETLTKKQKTLQDAMKENADKIDLLRKKLDKCKDTLGENSDEYNKLYRQLNKAQTEQVQFQKELSDTEKKLDSLGDELKDTADDFEDFDDSVSKAGDGAKEFDSKTVALGTAIGNLASGAIDFAIDKVSEFCQYLLELPQATEEFRIQMAKLEGSTHQYGYSIQETNELVKEMYGYLGDEQMAVNAITNLQGMGLAQDDLTATLDGAIAVWTAYGDSIPIESLTESINETAQVGKVTGVLADALNWAGISEDEFNKKLEACSSTEERARLITDQLNSSYGQSKASFDNATSGIQNARQASYDLMETEAQLGEELQVVTNEMTELKNVLLGEVLGAIQGTNSEMGLLSDTAETVSAMLQSPGWEGFGKILQFIWDTLQAVTMALGAFGLIIGDLLNGIIALITGDFTGAWESFQNMFINTGKLIPNILDGIDYAFETTAEKEQQAMSDIETTQAEKFARMKQNNQDFANNGKQTFHEFKENAQDDLNAVNNKDITLKRPNTEQAQSKVKTATDDMKKNEQSVSDKKITISNPNTSQAQRNLESATSGMKQNMDTVSRKKITLSSPNTSNATGGINSALTSIRSKLSSFKPSWSIPKPRLPRVSVSTSTKSIGGISIPIPSFSVSWGWKGGIIGSPTIFPTANGLVGVGDRYKGIGSNAEAILPLDSFYRHLDDKLDSMATGNVVNINFSDVHLHDNLDITKLSEQLAFELRRKARF